MGLGVILEGPNQGPIEWRGEMTLSTNMRYRIRACMPLVA